MFKPAQYMESSDSIARSFRVMVGFVGAFLCASQSFGASIPILDAGEQAAINNRAVSEANAAFQFVVPTIDPAYAGSYSAVDLGVVPTRIAADLGALTFKDSNTLLIDVNTYQASAEIDAVTVVRGAGNHITGFSGTGTKFANAPYIDGGLQYGPGGVLFYTAFGPNQLVQFKPGSINPDKYIDLTPLGVSASVGSLTFVPRGFGGAGYLKLISWDAKTWYNTYLSPDGTGTYSLGVEPPSVALPNVNWEGMALIAAGQPLFSANSVLINADLVDAVYAFQLDAQGNPKTSTQKHFMDVSDPVGMTIDPVTGDLLITTEQGPTAFHITLVKGFNAPVPPPTTTVSTSKGTYIPGEPIVVNFSNAYGVAGEWIGLFAAGTPDSAYVQWLYTDGTQVGNSGVVNGSVTFQSGLSSTGTYEARLFYTGGYGLQGNATFSVAVGPPGQASNPSPANNATGVTLTPTLTWTAGAGAVSHNVYFGTTPNPGSSQFKGNQSGTSYNPGTLAAQTSYYWRIDEVNGQGTTTGVVWKFTTGVAQLPPTISTSKSTYNPGETIVANFANAPGNAHDWIGIYTAGAADTAFILWSYTDGTQTGTAGITSGSVSFSGGLPSPGSYEARLYFNGTYVRQASASFTVAAAAPGQASNPSPAANATGVSVNPTLTWTAGSGATSHNVYFGTNPSPGASEFKGNQAGTSYAPGTLAAQTSYYWRIDEVNSAGTTTGVVWKFTTGTAAPPPTLTTSKATYNRNRPIIVNFKNASGSAHDWIGLYTVGAANTSFIQWLYTDGTQTGTAGLINGSVTFSSGLPTAGNYEARLFFNGSYTAQATASFKVQ